MCVYHACMDGCPLTTEKNNTETELKSKVYLSQKYETNKPASYQQQKNSSAFVVNITVKKEKTKQ